MRLESWSRTSGTCITRKKILDRIVLNKQTFNRRPRIYVYMSLVLRYGGRIGAGVMLIGLVLLHLHPGAGTPDNLPGAMFFRALLHFDAVAWMQAGILVLIATPILGLLTATTVAIFDRDWRLFINGLLLMLMLCITLLVR